MKSVSADFLPSPQLLADAFSEFISASSQLEASYRDLQEEVAHLNSQLSQRNAALTRSLADNDRMRSALQQMLDSMPCGVLVLDSAERVVMVNPEGRKLLGLGSKNVDNLQELSRVSRISFESLLMRSAHPLKEEICISTGEGKRWLAISNRRLSPAPSSRIAEAERAQLHSVWILRDITADKRAEQERETARRATVLAEISTILAHEIRNPLASLELFAELIEQDPAENSQWISHLRAGIRTLSGTVNNVLSMNGESSPRLGPVDLTKCVCAGVEFVKPIAEQAGVSISFVSVDDDVVVEGNVDAIRQVILNITSNAIRHSTSGASIQVSIEKALQDGRKRALVKISDEGCGINAEQIGRIFDAGFSGRGDSPGLGLAVCKRLMTQHGGDIRVSSRLNHGSTFQLEFPTL